MGRTREHGQRRGGGREGPPRSSAEQVPGLGDAREEPDVDAAEPRGGRRWVR